MDISPIASVSIAPVDLTAVTGIDVSVTPASPLAEASINFLDGNASTVELSTLGQVLSTTNTLQAQKISSDAASSDTTADFGKLVNTAELFVNAFNNFQTSNTDSLQNPLNATSDNALLLAINTQLISDTGTSVLASLAQIGIRFQTTPTATSNGQLALDLTALQAAFTTNPSATASVLTQSLQALGQVETNLITQNLSLFGTDTNTASALTAASLPVSQFDINAITAQLSALNSADALRVNAALQRLLADEALNEALVSNPAAATTATTTTTTVDNTATAAAPNASILPANSLNAGTGSATGNLSTLNASTGQTANTITETGNPLLATQNPSATAAGLNEATNSLASTGPTAAAISLITSPANSNINSALPNTIDNGTLRQTAAAQVLPTNQQLSNLTAAAPTQTPTQAQAVLAANLAASTVSALPLGSDTTLTSSTEAQSTRPNTIATSNQSATTATPASVNLAGNPVLAAQAISTPPATAFVTENTSQIVASATGSDTNTAVNVTPTPVSATILNPLILVAVAAYRLGDGIASTPVEKPAAANSETVPDIGAVSRIRPVNLDPHDGTSDDSRNEATRNAAHAHGHRPAPVASDEPPAVQHAIDVSV